MCEYAYVLSFHNSEIQLDSFNKIAIIHSVKVCKSVLGKQDAPGHEEEVRGAFITIAISVTQSQRVVPLGRNPLVEIERSYSQGGRFGGTTHLLFSLVAGTFAIFARGSK